MEYVYVLQLKKIESFMLAGQIIYVNDFLSIIKARYFLQKEDCQ